MRKKVTQTMHTRIPLIVRQLVFASCWLLGSATTVVAAPGDRFTIGTKGIYLAQGGLHLDWVDPRGPLSNVWTRFGPAYLEVGDRIVGINGMPFRGPAEFNQLINASQGASIVLTVIDGRTGTALQCRAQPKRIPNMVPPGIMDRSDPFNPNTPPSPPAALPRRTRIVLIGLTDDRTLSESIRQSVAQLMRTFRGIPNADIHDLTGSRANAYETRRAISTIKVNPTDALVCYYVGHGAFTDTSPFDVTRGHYLNMGTTQLMRKELVEAMQARNARLTVLVTDSCNVRSPLPPGAPVVIPTMLGRVQRGLANLFDNHEGFVDINSASTGEFAWFDNMRGGWFTDAFVSIANQQADNRHLNWDAFLYQLTGRTQFIFANEKAARRFSGMQPTEFLQQRQQTPQTFSKQLQPTRIRI